MDGESPPGVPLWVKVLAGIVLAVLVAVVVLHYMGRMMLHH